MMKSVTRTAALVGLFLLGVCISCQAANKPPRAVKGVLDLRQWDWRRDGNVPLNGEWAFHWQRFYTPTQLAGPRTPQPTAYVAVPGVWNDYVPGSEIRRGQGYATYRLTVLVPANTEEPLVLKVLTAATALDLYVNGQKVGGEGRVGVTAAAMQPGYRPFLAWVPQAGTDTLDIVAHVSNFHYRNGGLWNMIELGTQEQVMQTHLRKITRDYFLAGSFLLIGLYHLFLWFFLRRGLPVFFGMFCLLIALRILATGEYAIQTWVDWSWNTIVHTEFLALYLTAPVFAAFSRHLFPKEFSKRVFRWMAGLGFVFVAVVVFFPPLVFTYAVRPFQVFMIVSLGYGLWTYAKAWRNRRSGSGYFLAGFLVLFAAVINDILFTSFVIQTGHYFYFGLFVFIFSQALALSRQFSMAFVDLEAANRQMALANQELEIVNEETRALNEEMKAKSDAIHKQNEQLTKLNSELDSVVYRVSHDLRSPVASVLGLIDLMKMEKSEVAAYLNLQEKTMRRMDLMIQDIIDYARNNRTEVVPEPVDFQAMMAGVVEDHSHLENAGRIKTNVEVTQQGVFLTDAKRINMILNNLVSNAIRYHNLLQDQPFVAIRIRTDAQKAEITVQDNGQGIPAEHIGRIFEMFYRANEKTKGSGLGLYIVKEAVEKLGGTIGVQSELGKGTTFFITLPNLANK
ncbi:MAG: ATP-binding protein [Cytophagales bacterium]|nr:ATP-binding protein [Cytophagales bacterium]